MRSVNSKQQQFGIGSVADLIPGRRDRLVDEQQRNVLEAVVTASKASDGGGVDDNVLLVSHQDSCKRPTSYNNTVAWMSIR